MICCLFRGDIYLSFGISLYYVSLSTISYFFCGEISLPVKSPVASAVF